MQNSKSHPELIDFAGGVDLDDTTQGDMDVDEEQEPLSQTDLIMGVKEGRYF